jgi:hypothetical protein
MLKEAQYMIRISKDFKAFQRGQKGRHSHFTERKGNAEKQQRQKKKQCLDDNILGPSDRSEQNFELLKAKLDKAQPLKS